MTPSSAWQPRRHFIYDLLAGLRPLTASRGAENESTTVDMVADFHAMLGTRPAGGEATSAIQRALLAEEYEEYQAAEDARDLAGIADALADLVYVAYGTARCYGFDLDAVLAEVHASNMTKQPPAAPGGKAVKGPGYRPPDISAVLGRPRA
jgi:Phosphoribosyl-ATP pyrophosphohydrolase